MNNSIWCLNVSSVAKNINNNRSAQLYRLHQVHRFYCHLCEIAAPTLFYDIQLLVVLCDCPSQNFNPINYCQTNFIFKFYLLIQFHFGGVLPVRETSIRWNIFRLWYNWNWSISVTNILSFITANFNRRTFNHCDNNHRNYKINWSNSTHKHFARTQILLDEIFHLMKFFTWWNFIVKFYFSYTVDFIPNWTVFLMNRIFLYSTEKCIIGQPRKDVEKNWFDLFIQHKQIHFFLSIYPFLKSRRRNKISLIVK